jgi:hypothetical protein
MIYKSNSRHILNAHSAVSSHISHVHRTALRAFMTSLEQTQLRQTVSADRNTPSLTISQLKQKKVACVRKLRIILNALRTD